MRPVTILDHLLGKFFQPFGKMVIHGRTQPNVIRHGLEDFCHAPVFWHAERLFLVCHAVLRVVVQKPDARDGACVHRAFGMTKERLLPFDDKEHLVTGFVPYGFRSLNGAGR